MLVKVWRACADLTDRRLLFGRPKVVNVDPTAAVGEFDDVSRVQKYELDDEEYEKRTGTVLDFKRKNQLGRFNPNYAAMVRRREKHMRETEKERGPKLSLHELVFLVKKGGKQRA